MTNLVKAGVCLKKCWKGRNVESIFYSYSRITCSYHLLLIRPDEEEIRNASKYERKQTPRPRRWQRITLESSSSYIFQNRKVRSRLRSGRWLWRRLWHRPHRRSILHHLSLSLFVSVVTNFLFPSLDSFHLTLSIMLLKFNFSCSTLRLADSFSRRYSC